MLLICVILFTDIDECTSLPCQSHATCLDIVAGYQCACADGFTGSHCETGASNILIIFNTTFELEFHFHPEAIKKKL